MKSDIDRLMHENHVDYLWITGSGRYNPSMVYFTGVAHLTQADLFKKIGEEPVLFHGAMEREEAAACGLPTCSYQKYPWHKYFSQAENNPVIATALRYQQIFEDLGIKHGRMAVYGKKDIGWGYSVISTLEKNKPDIEFINKDEIDVLSKAMSTKDLDEVDNIRKMGEITIKVVSMVVDLIMSCEVRNEVLYQDKQPLTVGQVKGLINMWLSKYGAENPEDTIFAIGRDAGIPHSSGNPQDVLCLGKTIVMDIFPCQAGGGYFYDFTRTWCLGYAPDEIKKAYDQVLFVHNQILSEINVGKPFSEYQNRTCELFENLGHKTIKSDSQTENGYVHGIGHGVGLNIHEAPSSSGNSNDILLPGMVFTIEPGIYYPEYGYGIRIEDTIWISPDGKPEVMADYPRDLVLQMN